MRPNRPVTLIVFSLWTVCASHAWGAAALTRYPYIQRPGRDHVTIMWRTAAAAKQSVDCGVSGVYNITFSDAAATTDHEVTITGLAPGQLYNYRIREGATTVLSDPGQYYFRTDGGKQDKSFAFFVTGDNGAELPDGLQVYTGNMIRNVSPHPAFGLLTGDTVYPDGAASSYDPQLMSLWQPLLCNTPVWPCLGNHDWHVDPDSNFTLQWSLPNNEHYYSFDYGNAHFIALDTADGFLYDEANQLAWLRADLTAAHGRYEWTFVYYHHPLLTCTYKGNIPELSAILFPIFDEFKVDMVFNGHAHLYERLYPIHAGAPVDQGMNPNYTDPHGTIYVVSGCGGKFETNRPTSFCGPTAAFVDGKVAFTEVLIFDQKLYVVLFDSMTGAVLDYCSVTKTRPLTDVAVAPPMQSLRQNVPNPFNPSTFIPFDVASPGRVTLRIYRPDGSLVRDLVDAVYQPGAQMTLWDGRDRLGARLPSGVYLCRMETGNQAWAIKMLMVR